MSEPIFAEVEDVLVQPTVLHKLHMTPVEAAALIELPRQRSLWCLPLPGSCGASNLRRRLADLTWIRYAPSAVRPSCLGSAITAMMPAPDESIPPIGTPASAVWTSPRGSSQTVIRPYDRQKLSGVLYCSGV